MADFASDLGTAMGTQARTGIISKATGAVDDIIGNIWNGLAGGFGHFSSADKVKNAQQLMQAYSNNVLEQLEWSKQFKRSNELADYQQKLQKELMELQSSYNSPEAVAKSLAKAGINPAVAMGGGAGSSGQVSAGTPSIPEAAYGGMPAQVGVMHADELAALASAHKTAEEGSVVKRSIETMIQRMTAESNLSTAESARVNFHTSLDRLFSGKERQRGLDKSKSEIERNYNEAWEALARGDFEQAETRLSMLRGDLAVVEKRIAGEHASQEEIKTSKYADILQSEIDVAKSEKSRNYAQATEARASAAEHTASAEQKQFFTQLYKEPKVREALSKEIVQGAENAVKSGKMLDSQAEQVMWAAKQLEKSVDNYEIQMWSNIINTTINTAANAVGEFTKFGLAKKFLESKPSNIESGRGYMMQDGVLMLNPVR